MQRPIELTECELDWRGPLGHLGSHPRKERVVDLGSHRRRVSPRRRHIIGAVVQAAPTLATCRKRWEAVGDRTFSKQIAEAIPCDPANVNFGLGFDMYRPGEGFVERLTPKSKVRRTNSATSFERAMLRYRTILDQADALSANSKTAQPAACRHLRQAAVVLGVGSFDAYIRDTVIDTYLETMFDASDQLGQQERPRKSLEAWSKASLAALTSDPLLLARLADMPPAQARSYVAEVVYDNVQVRLVSSRFSSVLRYLDSVDIQLRVPQVADAAITNEDRFLYLVPAMFDAFANARHLIVHVNPKSGGTIPYCAHERPSRFLSDLLNAVVNNIEDVRSTKAARH